MRFLLVGRQRETGEVRLVSPDTYPTRQDALDRLGEAAAAVGGLTDHDLFVVDLEVAVPVVFYQAPAQRIEADEEPIADVWEAPAPALDALAEMSAVEDAVLEGPPPVWGLGDEVEPLAAELEAAAQGMIVEPEPVPEPVVEPEPVPEPVVEPEPVPEPVVAADTVEGAAPDEPLDLAEALRRAASRMESESILTPPNVEEVASSVDGVIPEIDPADSVEVEELRAEEPQAWPWETQPPAADAAEEVLAADEPAAMPVMPSHELQGFEPVGIDEPGLEDISLLTPVSADALEFRPVVLGEYAESVPEDEDDPFSALQSPVSAESPAEMTAAVEDEAPLETASATEPDVDKILPGDPLPAAEDAKGYEPGGTDIAAYTCADCVYAATCPKANQEGPATCGSFQWTSV